MHLGAVPGWKSTSKRYEVGLESCGGVCHLARVTPPGSASDAVAFLRVVDHGQPFRGDEVPAIRHVQAVRSRGVPN